MVNALTDELPEDGKASPKAAKKILQSRTFKDGAIYLCIRSDYKKPTWFCRIKVPKLKGYVWRSSGTTNEHEAYAFAESVYHQTLAQVLNGKTPNSKRYATVIEAYRTYLQPNAGQESVHNRLLMIDRITPFLKSKTLESTDTSLVSSIFAELTRLSSKGQLSPNTLKRNSSDLKQFFSWCFDNGHLAAIPRFPKINGDQSRRTHFDHHDWRKLVRHVREFVKIENKAVKRDRMMLRDYVLILANTGIRVGEARTLKWRDISQSIDTNSTSNIVLSVTGKTGRRDVVARYDDVRKYFRRIILLRQAELKTDDEPSPHVSPDSLIFCHPDGKPIGSFKKSFQSLLKSAGVEDDSQGQKRTIYSLRHTYATFRLNQDVNPYILAKNMGTSVAMIERFYGHTTNIGSAAELTKTGRRQAGGNAKTLDWLMKPDSKAVVSKQEESDAVDLTEGD